MTLTEEELRKKRYCKRLKREAKLEVRKVYPHTIDQSWKEITLIKPHKTYWERIENWLKKHYK